MFKLKDILIESLIKEISEKTSYDFSKYLKKI